MCHHQSETIHRSSAESFDCAWNLLRISTLYRCRRTNVPSVRVPDRRRIAHGRHPVPTHADARRPLIVELAGHREIEIDVPVPTAASEVPGPTGPVAAHVRIPVDQAPPRGDLARQAVIGPEVLLRATARPVIEVDHLVPPVSSQGHRALARTIDVTARVGHLDLEAARDIRLARRALVPTRRIGAHSLVTEDQKIGARRRAQQTEDHGHRVVISTTGAARVRVDLRAPREIPSRQRRVFDRRRVTDRAGRAVRRHRAHRTENQFLGATTIDDVRREMVDATGIAT
jgi:hypothetical protein